MKRRRFIKIAGLAASAFGIGGIDTAMAADSDVQGQTDLGHCPQDTAPAQPFVPAFDQTRFERKLADFEPSFYSVRVGRKNDARGIGHGWYDRLKILHISDTHQYNALIEEAVTLAQGRCDVICNTGDDGNGSEKVGRERSLEWLGKAANAVRGSNAANVPYLAVKGNHDICNILRSDYRREIGSLVEGYAASAVWGSPDAMFGHYDVKVNDSIGTVRFLMLDPFDYEDGQFPTKRSFMTCTFSQAQIDWLVATLRDAAEKGCKVITMMHYSFGDNSIEFSETEAKPDAESYQDPFLVPDIIDAFQHGTALKKLYPDSRGIQDIRVDIAPSGPKLEYVCHLFGHIHSKNQYRCRKPDGSKDYDMLMLGEAALGAYGNALNKAYRYPNSVNDIACSVLEVDTVEKCIYRVSYGSYMPYDGTQVSRITKIPYRMQ